EIGFLIILPFLVIDMIVATLTMSMGMMMMPPTILALPFKMVFLVLIVGWKLVASGLVGWLWLGGVADPTWLPEPNINH
ncbi:hypothetical protein ABTH28_18915, partial [Acinetobacter baumannii]